MAKAVATTFGAQSFLLSGFDMTQAKLGALGKVAGSQAIRHATKAVATHVQHAAKQYVPVDTGLLRDSIKVLPMPRSRVRIGYITTTGKITMEKAGGTKRRKRHRINRGKAFYGAFIEFGLPKRGMLPQPFLRPAAAAIQPHARKIFHDRLRVAVKTLAGWKKKSKKQRAALSQRVNRGERKKMEAAVEKALEAFDLQDFVTGIISAE